MACHRCSINFDLCCYVRRKLLDYHCVKHKLQIYCFLEASIYFLLTYLQGGLESLNLAGCGWAGSRLLESSREDSGFLPVSYPPWNKSSPSHLPVAKLRNMSTALESTPCPRATHRIFFSQNFFFKDSYLSLDIVTGNFGVLSFCGTMPLSFLRVFL